MQYFGSNIVEGVAKSWVETQMSWVEVDGTGWSWVEVDEAWWRRVHRSVIRTFKTPWGKLPNLLEVKLTTDVILQFLSSVNNGIFVYFWSCRFVYEINLMNTCCTSDKVASKIKINIKETFMRNEGFLQVFMWRMDCSQNCLANLVFSEWRADFCYSVPLLGTLGAMVRKADVKKFCNPSWFDIWAFRLLVTLCSMP